MDLLAGLHLLLRDPQLMVHEREEVEILMELDAEMFTLPQRLETPTILRALNTRLECRLV